MTLRLLSRKGVLKFKFEKGGGRGGRRNNEGLRRGGGLEKGLHGGLKKEAPLEGTKAD